MMKHSQQEITDKLRQADKMIAEGKVQSEIARALGVSVMTLHRWRKRPPHAGIESGPREMPNEEFHTSNRERQQASRIAELELENSDLRRLVIDILLEKLGGRGDSE